MLGIISIINRRKFNKQYIDNAPDSEKNRINALCKKAVELKNEKDSSLFENWYDSLTDGDRIMINCYLRTGVLVTGRTI